ncbi:lipopolysaccharide heptosyltransferase II [Candidatus Omnitrophota bacterium]
MTDTGNKTKRILIVNVNWLGDVLFSTPFIKAVSDRYKNSYIAALVHPRCREILANNPKVDELIIYDEDKRHRSIFGKIALVAELRKKNFDTAFVLHRSFTKALLVFLAGVKERIGYATKNRQRILTGIAEEPPPGIHKVEYFLNILKTGDNRSALSGDIKYEFYPGRRDDDHIVSLLKSKGLKGGERFCVLNPGGNWDPKRWPRENFAQAADAIAGEFGLKIVITGAKKDIRLAEAISSVMKEPPVIVCGDTTLGQLGALMKRADLVIANDTGPMHIAVAMGSRVIALFGPTSPEITGPYGKGIYKVVSKHSGCEVPCYDVTCQDNRCMSAIKVEDVLSAARELLKGRS